VAVASAILGSFFAAADAALTALPEAHLQTLTQQNSPTGATFRRYEAERVRLHSRWLVARVALISLAATLFAEAADDVVSPGIGPLVAVLGAVILYGTTAEVLGTLARRRPAEVGAIALRWLKPFELAMAPLALPLSFLGRLVEHRLPKERPVDARVTETEVERAVTEGEKAGAIANEPAEMIRNVLDFKDQQAREVMVPRRKIIGIEIGTSLEKAIELMSTEKHSRYPIYKETLDNIIGSLYAKDLFAIVRDNQIATTKLADVVRSPVLFVVETQPVVNVLKEMRSRHLHLAIVSDEFGGTSGLVTLEDIIEEIVGEIRDQADAVDARIQDLGDGRLVADATISLADLSAHLGKEITADGDFESLGGLLVHRAGRVPAVGATLTLDGFKLIVREADETRVVKVEIVPEERKEAAPLEASSVS
jgi:CBS domain containing-hemolysin-like protein